MKRKIYNELLQWKTNRKGSVALMIDGARRVGKSYIVREFAEKEYKSHIIIDFNNPEKKVEEIFENYLSNLDMFFSYLSLLYGVTLYERDSIIVFDEVQLYPKARAAIKYLVADGRCDYIETGSLVSINKNVKDIVIPSEEHHINMYPMDFEEFLWATGDEMTMPFVRKCYEAMKPLGPIHRKIMDNFRRYMIVGGMPQAVAKYVETLDFRQVDEIKRDILKLYKLDIEKYADGNETYLKSIFDKIPSQLQRHEKKFRMVDIAQGARYKNAESSFFWLDESRIVNLCYNTTHPGIGLSMNEDRTTLKCYMADTGLLVSMVFNDKQPDDENLYIKLLLGKLELNEGMFMENIVAQMLKVSGHNLWFYSNYSDVAADRMEIDFLISKHQITSRHNISLIEVKSGANYTLNSINKCKAKYKQYLSTSYILHTADLKVDGDVVYLPLYMTSLL